MRIALLTPTYGPDLARFRLSRESILASGCALEHVAVVQTEDYAAFAAAGLDSRVRLIPTAELLPPAVEAERLRLRRYPKLTQKLMRSLHKRTAAFPLANYQGWNVQQLVKLSAPLLLGYDAMVSLDSDLIVCGPDPFPSFLRNGQIALNYFGDTHYWHPHWEQMAGRVLGLPLPTAPLHGSMLRNYVVHPFVFLSASLDVMQRELEARHRKVWWQALLDLPLGSLSEFTVYGHFVEQTQAMQGHFAHDLSARTRWIYTEAEHREAERHIAAAFVKTSTDFLVIQSSRHYPIEPYLPLLRTQIAQAQRSSRS